MKATIEWIISAWQLYWGDGYYQYLLLVSAVYLLAFHRKKRSVRQTLAFSALILFVFICPLSARIIRFCIGETVYWRVLWLMPSIPLIALAATEFLRRRNARFVQALLLLLSCGIIALSGRDMLSADNYTLTSNRQKVPDEVAHVCNMIREEAKKDGITKIRVMGDEHIATYLRIYDPSVQQAYGRWGRSARNQSCRRAYHLIKKAEPRKYKTIARLSKKGHCNFLVISVPDEKIKRITYYGYVKIGNVGAYSVFQLEDS